MKKYPGLLLLAAALSLAPRAAVAETWGIFPGFRFGYGKGTYRADDVLSPTTNKANGASSWASFGEFRIDGILIFDEALALGVELGYLSSSIDNPKDDAGDPFAFSGWTFGAVGMLGVFDWAFLSGRLGLVRGDVEGWLIDTKSSTGYRMGATFNVPVVHNTKGSITLGLGLDYLSSGKVNVAGSEASFGAWAVTLDVTGAFTPDAFD